jgi:hypothetical protein
LGLQAFWFREELHKFSEEWLMHENTRISLRYRLTVFIPFFFEVVTGYGVYGKGKVVLVLN